MAVALAVVLIDRVPRLAARASAPTLSTPGSPCRNVRNAAFDLVTSARGVCNAVVMPNTLLIGADSDLGNEQSHEPSAGLECASVDVLVVDHPLAQSRLTAMRDEKTDSATFRAALHE